MGGWSVLFFLLLLFAAAIAENDYSPQQVFAIKRSSEIEPDNDSKGTESLWCPLKDYDEVAVMKPSKSENSYCAVSLKCQQDDAFIKYSMEEFDYDGRRIQKPSCLDYKRDDKDTEILRIYHNNYAFRKIINENYVISSDNAIAFYYFYMPDAELKKCRHQNVVDKIKKCTIVRHSLFIVLGSKDSNCVDSEGILLESINYENIGKCRALWEIRKNICLKLRKIDYFSEPNACEGLDFVEDTEVVTTSFQSTTERQEATTPEKETVDTDFSSTTSATTEIPTTTHNPYVGNYVSEEEEARYIESLKERARKETKSAKEPERQQEIAVELILTILILVFMGAFSVSVILYNWLILDNELAPSYEDIDTSEEE